MVQCYLELTLYAVIVFVEEVKDLQEVEELEIEMVHRACASMGVIEKISLNSNIKFCSLIVFLVKKLSYI